MVFSSRNVRRFVAPLGFLIVAGLCQFIPLLDVLGYEYAAVLGLLLAVYGGAAAIFAAHRQKRNAAPVFIAWLGVLGQGAALLALGLLISLINTYFIQRCQVDSGLKLYLFITLPALWHFTALGALLGTLFKRRRTGLSLLLFYLMATVVHSLYQFWWGQQVPSNLMIAFANASGFAGFTDRLFWHPSFSYFRALVVALGLGYLALLLLLDRTVRQRWLRPAAVVALVGVLVVSALALIAPDKWGIGSGRRRITAPLDQVYETEHVVLHYPANPEIASRIARLAEDHEWYFHHLTKVLNHTPQWKLHSFIYADLMQMQAATGADGFIFTQPWHHEIHIPYDLSAQGVGLDTLKHEMVHILLADFGQPVFRVNLNRGILEGAAVALAEDLFRGAEFQETAAAAQRSGQLTPATELFSLVGFGFGSASVGKSYSLAGAFIGFLAERYGMEKLKELYGGASFAGVYGKSLAELDGEWQAALASVPASDRQVKRLAHLFNDEAFPPIYKNRCPRLGSREVNPYQQAQYLQSEKKYDDAIAQYQMLYVREQQNPEWLVRIAEIHLEQGQKAEAIKLLQSAAQLERMPYTLREEIMLTLFNLLAQERRWVEAQQVLIEAEQFDLASPEWRELRYRVLRATPPVRELIFAGLAQGRPRAAQQRFRQAAGLEPTFGLTYYFWAEVLNQSETDSERVAALQEKFLQHTEGLPGLKTRVLLRLGLAEYQRGQWAKAREHFAQAQELAPNVQQRQTAADWLARLTWRETYQPQPAAKAAD